MSFLFFLVSHFLRPVFEQQHTFGTCFYRQTLVRKDAPILWSLMSRQWLVVFDLFLVAGLLSPSCINSICLVIVLYTQVFVRKDVPKRWNLINRHWLVGFDVLRRIPGAKTSSTEMLRICRWIFPFPERKIECGEI